MGAPSGLLALGGTAPSDGVSSFHLVDRFVKGQPALAWAAISHDKIFVETPAEDLSCYCSETGGSPSPGLCLLLPGWQRGDVKKGN